MPRDTPFRLRRLKLSLRLMALLALGLLVSSVLQGWLAERVLESATLEQSKSQALILLYGIERQIRGQAADLDPGGLQQILAEAIRDESERNFVVESAYVYDPEGRVLAHEPPGTFPPKDLAGRYGQVLESGTPYLGDEIEYGEGNGAREPKVDLIVPVRVAGQVVAGLEVELDMRRTMQAIKQLDDRYERFLIITLAATTGVLLLFVSLVVMRGLVRPIGIIGQITGRVAAGELDARINMQRDDEIGTLADAIDSMADSLQRLFAEQEEGYLATLKSLAKALEAKDSYTASHSGRVAHYSVLLARRIGLPQDQLALLKQGALMHDLGKIGIPDAILNKPAALDDREFEEMRKHPEYTYSIMRPLKRFKAFAEIARWHHERWDGKGYPDGLRGEDVPLLARIVSIADTWDAMTGDRVYRRGMPIEKALGIFVNERDSGQWDPQLVDAFVAMIEEEHAMHRHGGKARTGMS